MNSFTFIHTADLHLDLPVRGWRGDEKRLMIRREEYRHTFKRMIDLAKERQVDFFLIAGDFLEHETVSRSTVEWVTRLLGEISKTRVWIAPGNHDPYRNDSFYRTLPWPENVHIFSGKWEEHVFAELGVRIYGKGFSDYEETTSSLPQVSDTDDRRIMVVHGTYGEEQSPYFPLSREGLTSLEMDYIALGHIHKPMTERLGNRRKTLIRYPGSPEGLNWKETGERTVSLVTCDEEGFHLEEVPIESRRYEVAQVDVTGLEHMDQILDHVRETAKDDKSKKAYRRVQLVGRRGTDLAFNLDWMTHQLEEQGFGYVEWLDETKPDFDLEQLRSSDGVIGAFIRRMDQRMKTAEESQQEVLTRALYKGLDTLLMSGGNRR